MCVGLCGAGNAFTCHSYEGATKQRLIRSPYVTHHSYRIWDIIPVATQKRVQDGLLACLASPREDQSDEERNNICKTASYVAEVNKERGRTLSSHAHIGLEFFR